jgi:hypothetical protein
MGKSPRPTALSKTGAAVAHARTRGLDLYDRGDPYRWIAQPHL